MKCGQCGNNFNEFASPLCPHCGADHAVEVRRIRQAALFHRRRWPSRAKVVQLPRRERAEGSSIMAEADTPLVRQLIRQAHEAARRGAHETAQQLAEAALFAAPNQLEALGLLGMALLEQGKVDEATAVLSRAAQQAPQDAQVVHWLDRLERARQQQPRRARPQGGMRNDGNRATARRRLGVMAALAAVLAAALIALAAFVQLSS